jgi:prophage DNA circulation protein
MTWREDLRRVTLSNGRNLIGASFRGVPFLVESVERSGGRRAVVHEFPLRDDPFAEDLGRKARGFRVDGYVIGDDYLTQRDALLAALEDVEGTGEVVLPSYGVKRAICINATVREARGEGGIAMIAIEFAETPTQAPVPTEVVDSVEQVSDSAAAALVATDAEFVEQYDADGMPAFALVSAETALTSAIDGMASKLAPIVNVSQELAELTGRVALLTAQASSLVRTPADVVENFRSVVTGLAETILAAPGAVMDALIDSYGVDLGVAITATTGTRARELVNQTALTGALRRVIAIEAARLTPLVPYESIEQATEARTAVASMLEEQATSAGDTTYPALVNLRSEVLRAVPGATQFARITTITRSNAIPSLLLAYQLYGSVDNEADIIARNTIDHPGFCAGDLKVLSDV